MDSNAFREAATAAIEEIVKYYETLGSRPVLPSVEPGYLRNLLPSEAPQQGEEWAAIQKDMESKVVPGVTHWNSPNFFAFFPCPSSYPSILGEMYSATFSGAAFNWICSPACTELETIVLDWVAKLIGLPDVYLSTGPTLGGGVLQGTASETIHIMMVAACDKYLRASVPEAFDLERPEREREGLLAARRSRLVALASTAAHAATRKAAMILGLRFRAIPVSKATGYALTGNRVLSALEQCGQEGLEPFFLTTTLGTTDTCAQDDFSSIAKMMDNCGYISTPIEIWVHVDAAYAGAALVCPEYRRATAYTPNYAHNSSSPLQTFHSFNFNMHKWLLTNFDASCAFVRDRRWLVQAFGGSQLDMGVYANAFTAGGLVTDYRDWGVALGRRFRALKVWFVLRTYGVEGLQTYIRRGISLGERFAGGLLARKDLFEILAGPVYALTVFAMVGPAGPEGKEDSHRNERTQSLCDKLNLSGQIWVTRTTLDGRFAIRFMTANRLTTEEHVSAALRLIVQTAEEVVEEALKEVERDWKQ